MKNIIIINQNKYFYLISKFLFEYLTKYFNNIQLIDYDNSYKYTDDIYILFYILDNLPKNYIVYNFEQFTTNKIWKESYFNFLNKSLFNIDYSINNIIILHKKNINSYFLPFHSLKLFKYPKNIIKDIDILFIGNINDRRKKWLNKLNNFNIKICKDIFYDKSLELFARSKILLNIHYYDGISILEITRILPALENNCIILSESSNDEYYNLIYNDIIKITNIDNIYNDINNILENYIYYYEYLINNLSKINNNIYNNNLLDLINYIINLKTL